MLSNQLRKQKMWSESKTYEFHGNLGGDKEANYKSNLEASMIDAICAEGEDRFRW